MRRERSNLKFRIFLSLFILMLLIGLLLSLVSPPPAHDSSSEPATIISDTLLIQGNGTYSFNLISDTTPPITVTNCYSFNMVGDEFHLRDPSINGLKQTWSVAGALPPNYVRFSLTENGQRMVVTNDSFRDIYAITPSWPFSLCWYASNSSWTMYARVRGEGTAILRFGSGLVGNSTTIHLDPIKWRWISLNINASEADFSKTWVEPFRIGFSYGARMGNWIEISNVGQIWGYNSPLHELEEISISNGTSSITLTHPLSYNDSVTIYPNGTSTAGKVSGFMPSFSKGAEVVVKVSGASWALVTFNYTVPKIPHIQSISSHYPNPYYPLDWQHFREPKPYQPFTTDRKLNILLDNDHVYTYDLVGGGFDSLLDANGNILFKGSGLEVRYFHNDATIDILTLYTSIFKGYEVGMDGKIVFKASATTPLGVVRLERRIRFFNEEIGGFKFFGVETQLAIMEMEQPKAVWSIRDFFSPPEKSDGLKIGSDSYGYHEVRFSNSSNDSELPLGTYFASEQYPPQYFGVGSIPFIVYRENANNKTFVLYSPPNDGMKPSFFATGYKRWFHETDFGKAPPPVALNPYQILFTDSNDVENIAANMKIHAIKQYRAFTNVTTRPFTEIRNIGLEIFDTLLFPPPCLNYSKIRPWNSPCTFAQVDEVAKLNVSVIYAWSPWLIAPWSGTRLDVLNLTIAPDLGGEKAFKEFIDYAHSKGLKVIAWTPWATWAPDPGGVMYNNPDWGIRMLDGNYVQLFGRNRLFNLANEQAFNYYASTIIRLHEELGLDGIFLDSFGTVTQRFHYNPEEDSYTPELYYAVKFIKTLNEHGIITYPESNEICMVATARALHPIGVVGQIVGIDDDPFAVIKYYSAPRIASVVNNWTATKRSNWIIQSGRWSKISTILPLPDSMYVHKDGSVEWFYDNGDHAFIANASGVFSLHRPSTTVYSYYVRLDSHGYIKSIPQTFTKKGVVQQLRRGDIVISMKTIPFAVDLSAGAINLLVDNFEPPIYVSFNASSFDGANVRFAIGNLTAGRLYEVLKDGELMEIIQANLNRLVEFEDDIVGGHKFEIRISEGIVRPPDTWLLPVAIIALLTIVVICYRCIKMKRHRLRS